MKINGLVVHAVDYNLCIKRQLTRTQLIHRSYVVRMVRIHLIPNACTLNSGPSILIPQL
jgi:hypothetical protein